MHLVEKQYPSEKELIQQIKEAERELLMLDKGDQALAQLSLTIQLYYLNGGNEEGKKKALNIIDKFKNAYPLKSHFAAFKSNGFVEFTDKSYQSAYKKALDTNVLEWHLTTAESGQVSGSYVLSIGTARDNYGCSYMEFNFPISLVYEENGRAEFYSWISYLIQNLEVLHGYAGLSIQLPHDRHPYQFYEYGVTRQYWGITPDGPSFFTLDWETGTRSINWYTFIGKNLKDKLINQPFYETTLKNVPDLELTEINGCMVIKAGELPRLGNKSKPLPLSYVVVNQLCKAVRTDMPTDAMHTAYRGPRYSLSQVYYWIRRWDNTNFSKGVFDFDGIKEDLLPILGEYSNEDRIVPYSGIWTPFDFDGIEQHLTQGQEFPEEAEYDWDNGELDSKPAVWKLISRDDGGVVVLPNPF
ncbi:MULTISPECIES: type VI immunity family protein [Acinetobacter]|nr:MULTISPECIES: type VI immunity family protein [Acinetobacter]